MKHKVFVYRIDGDRTDDEFQVRFTVGVQTFNIGPAWYTDEEAREHAKAFHRALKNMQPVVTDHDQPPGGLAGSFFV